jgi:hypothetical protein
MALQPQTEHPHTKTDHPHVHGPNCGHARIKHDGHVDYLHDGHLHFQDGSKIEEHSIAVSKTNPAGCTPDHKCSGHDASHRHGKGCGHEAVPHGDHTDYIVQAHLHHVHGGHCDDHGPVALS